VHAQHRAPSLDWSAKAAKQRALQAAALSTSAANRAVQMLDAGYNHILNRLISLVEVSPSRLEVLLISSGASDLDDMCVWCVLSRILFGVVV
jgi:hypothetical protein